MEVKDTQVLHQEFHLRSISSLTMVPLMEVILMEVILEVPCVPTTPNPPRLQSVPCLHLQSDILTETSVLNSITISLHIIISNLLQ